MPSRGRQGRHQVSTSPLTVYQSLNEGRAMRLEGRAAVVAGGAGGLGGATVRLLAGHGVGVGVLDPDGERAAALAAESPGRGTGVAGDSDDADPGGTAIPAAQDL